MFIFNNLLNAFNLIIVCLRVCVREENMTISDRTRMFLYQITNAVVQLTETEISNALSNIDCSTTERSKFESAINTYRLSGSHLVFKKRHPVLLILDEV